MHKFTRHYKLHTNLEVSKWRDIVSGALCMSSGTNSDLIVFITTYIYFRKSLQAASPEVLITRPPSFCLPRLGCDQNY